MNAKEKVAYLKGLMDGLVLDESKPETKVIHALADALDCVAEELAVLKAKAEKAEDYLDELDHDLGELEADFYECDDDDYDYDDDDDEYEYYDEDEDIIDELLDCDGADCEGCDGCDKED